MRTSHFTTHFFALVFCFCGLFASSCQQKVVEPVVPVAQGKAIITRDIAADPMSAGRFTYFNLKDSTIVTGADTATAKWDIAFRGTTIWINGGTGRFGQAQAQVLTAQDYDALVLAPETGWRVDSSATALAIPTGSGRGWYNYSSATNIISPIPGVVIALRSADGKYAKLQIQSYYRGAPAMPDMNSASRYYTFRYFYQADGSRNLK
ncbi:MAG: hypothetical protein EAZ92_09185 [Candidatus Kapaibacterium sp.]|nr:MAG: hypothetical protein EAZ92_09185 [Candidatus Kapabacteria bacterium]